MAKGRYQEWKTEEGQTLLRGWKRAGKTDAEIADKIGIAVGTLYAWKNDYPEINDALKKGKQVCDFEAEDALISLFGGHYVTETITEVDEKEGIQKKHIRQVKRWIEPDHTAIIFYLKCRAGWKEKGQEEQTEAINKLREYIAAIDKEAHVQLVQQ